MTKKPRRVVYRLMKNVPIPLPGGGKKIKTLPLYPFYRMAPGDSFGFAIALQKKVVWAARDWAKKQPGPRKKFSVRNLGKRGRCWRVK